jgi:putative phosphoribosyl transferase
VPALEGHTAILADDGMATGASMQVAVAALRGAGLRRIAVAVPVAAPEAVTHLEAAVDELVCIQSPADFRAVGEFYEDFDQTDDREVCRLLQRSGKVR